MNLKTGLKMANSFTTEDADKWYLRNRDKFLTRETDPIMKAVRSIETKPRTVFEFGCSDGYRLQWMHEEFGSVVAGVELSPEAIKNGKPNVYIEQGNIESYKPEFKHDLVVFGFCLYLLDVNDLFSVASKANELLHNNGHIIIWDYNTTGHKFREYIHSRNVEEHHMDFSKMFTWNPLYWFIDIDTTAPEGPVITLRKNDKNCI